MRQALFILTLSIFAVPLVAAERQTLYEAALERAIIQFETARPRLPATVFGVDVETYHDALTLQRFSSRHWGGPVTVAPIIRAEATGSCGRYAAFVHLPPAEGAVQLVLCPQFFRPGSEALRVLTLLHEMVHVVAGADECRAMAFTALVEKQAMGRFTPADAYWRANDCEGSGFFLP
ncbi:hypothetical protein [Devosia sp.]|uniref:hypothetical protein n=1 Tax=Devosia sp. TaxID=1871048 RepID=UPI002AFE2EA4|nr:hypothetical protein [Devosia sp.]